MVLVEGISFRNLQCCGRMLSLGKEVVIAAADPDATLRLFKSDDLFRVLNVSKMYNGRRRREPWSRDTPFALLGPSGLRCYVASAIHYRTLE